MEKHQKIAVTLYISTLALIYFRGSSDDEMISQSVLLLLFLVPILFYKLIAYFASFGFPEVFARDYGSQNSPTPYAVFFWLLFIIACLYILFDWHFY